MENKRDRKKVVIVGGGLVGSLNALYFGKSDQFDVLLCEKRSDIRKDIYTAGKSINLALSYRGICALKKIGIGDKILENGIPMRGRMIHSKNGDQNKIPYGTKDQCLYSLDRKLLNEWLLSEAEANSNVQIVFNCKLLTVNFKKQIATFMEGDKERQEYYDLIVGNDGAFSCLRSEMMKWVQFDYSQTYITHGYLELYFPPLENGEYSMPANFLHIWPRNEFMLIALPNPDGNFTGTLFMPMEIFSNIKNEEDILTFFYTYFPDAVKLMGEKMLIEKYQSREASTMITVKCSQYNYNDSCILMGDSAHAMVPFFGQGMNCGFEDVLIFHTMLEENNYQLEGVCQRFGKSRPANAAAICDLALYNYIEMRKLVNTVSFYMRKKFDNFIHWLFPGYWAPLYTMVTFTQTPYAECLKRKSKQDKIIRDARNSIMMLVGAGIALWCWQRRSALLKY